MSEINIFSIGLLVGAAAFGIGKLIASACGTLGAYHPKNGYVATPEREMLLQSLFTKNFAKFEDKYLLGKDSKTFNGKIMDDSLRKAKSKAIHVMSMFEAISNVESMVFVAGQKHVTGLNKAKSIISDIKTKLEAPIFDIEQGGKLAEAGETIIRKITNDSHSLLARAEEEMAINVIGESMTSLGYGVKTGKMALNATKGAFAFRARVSGGRIKVDTTSFPGISCQSEIQKIETNLEERGLVLQRLCESHRKWPKDPVVIKDPFPLFEEMHHTTQKKHIEFPHVGDGVGDQHQYLKLLNRTLKENRLKIWEV